MIILPVFAVAWFLAGVVAVIVIESMVTAELFTNGEGFVFASLGPVALCGAIMFRLLHPIHVSIPHEG